MKIKTSEARDEVLDYLVAKCERKHYPCTDSADNWYTPSTDWAQGGPIIERENIYLIPHYGEWEAYKLTGPMNRQYSETPLTAAMQCYVASKLGNEIEIPKELL